MIYNNLNNAAWGNDFALPRRQAWNWHFTYKTALFNIRQYHDADLSVNTWELARTLKAIGDKCCRNDAANSCCNANQIAKSNRNNLDLYTSLIGRPA